MALVEAVHMAMDQTLEVHVSVRTGGCPLLSLRIRWLRLYHRILLGHLRARLRALF
jgi:hypothetical protein